ncbi:hypothetical protein PG984_012892 [Apiospora sp. TS-2023a]
MVTTAWAPRHNIPGIPQPQPLRRPPWNWTYDPNGRNHAGSIPFWEAPWPFETIEDDNETTRKVNPSWTEGEHMRKFLEKLLQLPPDFDMTKKYYFLDSGISIALNAYNMRIPEREQRVWAFFHWKGQNSCLDVPRAPAANFDWSKLQNQAEYSRLTAGRVQQSAQLDRERRAPFPSVVAFPLRWNNRLTWYDPWHVGHANRWADIRTFWTNVAPWWLQNQGTGRLRRVNYTSLATVQANHPTMRPMFSQISCVALAVWLMRHLEDPAPLRPPDQPDMLTGQRNSSLADLAAVTLQTLRESSNLIAMPPPPFPLVGQGAATRRYIRDNCRINQDARNRLFRAKIRWALRKFVAHPTLKSRGMWILNAVAP